MSYDNSTPQIGALSALMAGQVEEAEGRLEEMSSAELAELAGYLGELRQLIRRRSDVLDEARLSHD